MREQEHYRLAMTAAETMYMLIDLDYQEGNREPDALMRRLKDLSAYSLTHAEILTQREGVELLALGMFFGMAGGDIHRRNQERLRLLSEETFAYRGRSEVVEAEIAARSRAAGRQPKKEAPSDDDKGPRQARLL
jgi:hypothetical protein